VYDTAPPPSTEDGYLRLTYVEIAARIGGTTDAARQLVRRKRWQRIAANRKGAPSVIMVPETELSDEQWRQDRPPRTVDRAPPPSIIPEVIAAKDAHITTLTDQLARADTRVEAAEARAAKAELRAEKAEGRIDILLALIPAPAQHRQDPLPVPQEPPQPASAGEAAPPQPATPEAPSSVQAGETAQPVGDEASRDVLRRLQAAEDELAAVQGALWEAERELAAQAGEPPQSPLQALVEAGGAVSDGAGCRRPSRGRGGGCYVGCVGGGRDWPVSLSRLARCWIVTALVG
jgi:hypothetical protein